jgi:membrane-associated HD superfamily phosphohydrolase
MQRKLITSFSYLFFACKCTGLTAYSFKRNVTNQSIIFKRNRLGRFINYLSVLIILLILLSITSCFEEDNAIESTFSDITQIIYGSYFSALILTLNCKQTRVVKTFYKIVSFKVMIQKILKRNIDTFNLSRILRYYVFIRNWKRNSAVYL